MISTWELFRFYHGDGSSKDWAIHDNGNGTVTTRWGPTLSMSTFFDGLSGLFDQID